MKVHLANREIALSVRELVNFSTGPGGRAGTGGTWRTALGQAWHEELRSRVESGEPSRQGELLTAEGEPSVPVAPMAPLGVEAQFEVPVQGILLEAGWRLSLQGRIDQAFCRPEEVILREVKTVDRRLPADAEELRDWYPEYFAQAALYEVLAPLEQSARERLGLGEGIALRSELLLVDIREGTVQIVPLGEADRIELAARQAEFGRFFEAKRARRSRWREVTFAPVFSHYRDGQAESLDQLRTALREPAPVFFEAPTGFGKTGVALQLALEGLPAGEWDRVVYLTSKRSGQIGVMETLRRVTGDGELLRVHRMRSRAEQIGTCPVLNCQSGTNCREDLEARWKEAGVSLESVFVDGLLDETAVLEVARQAQVCPYEIARAALPWAEVWVGDANYVFSPRHRGVFAEQPGFDPATTLLLVDEAHHLPSRVAEAHSVTVDGAVLQQALGYLHESGASLRRAVDALAERVSQWPAGKRLETRDEYLLQDLLEAFARAADEEPLPWDQVPPAVAELFDGLLFGASLLEREGLEIFPWVDRSGVLQLTCLDAAMVTGPRLREFARVMLMSATLSPVASMARDCGLGPGEHRLVRARAPWREGSCTVAVDVRADTRFRRREEFFRLTAETTVALAREAVDPVAVFFPSYAYAESVAEELRQVAPGLTLEMPERRLSTWEQEAFLERALEQADVLFLVLGGSFAEGIDPLGGRVSRAMVVGPALPEVNARQEAKMASRRFATRPEAFREVYQIPGMRKVNQALGRLVRAPGQRASILLHGRRLGEESYTDLLDPEYVPTTVIQSGDDLEAWLAELSRCTSGAVMD